MTVRPVRSADRNLLEEAAEHDALRSQHHPATILSPKRFFQALLRFGGEFCVRYFADFVRKLTGDLANVFELLHVPLTERTHKIMDPQLHPHHQRQLFVHPKRQDPNDFRAGGREPADEEHDLQLEPAPMLLKTGVVFRWPRVWGPFRNWL